MWRWILLLTVLAAAGLHACPLPGDSVFTDPFEKSSRVFRYVSAAAPDNSGDGSFAQPWKTIQYASDHLAAGDTACVRAGTYNEIVAPTHYGTAAAGPVTLRNYPGEKPVIDGTGFSVPNGQWGLMTLVDPHDVVVRGFELRNFITASTAQVPIGIYLTGAGGDIVVADNRVHDIRNTGNGCAANAFGIKVDGTQAPASLHDLLLGGNEVDHLVLGCSESFSLDGNVERWRIERNVVHDTNNIAIGAIGFEGVAPDPAYDQARDGVIADNHVYNISSFGNPAYGNEYAADGIYIDGGTRIVIERNRVHNVDIGIEVASEHSGRTSSFTTVRSNLVYWCNTPGISLGGYANGVGGTSNVDVVNNTLFRNDSTNSGSGEVQIQYHATGNRIINNLIVASTQGVLLNSFVNVATPPAALDYNLYFSASATTEWTWKGSTYGTFTTFKNASLQEANGLVANPLFVDTLLPDLHLQVTSMAIDRGTNLGVSMVGSTDADGLPRIKGTTVDLGAYER